MRGRTMLRIQTGIAAVAAVLGLLTMIVPEWIEVITGLEPDGGSGELEFVTAGPFLLIAAVSGIAALRTRRRSAAG